MSYAPTHVNTPPTTLPSSSVSATGADPASLKMLLMVPVTDEFRIDGDDEDTYATDVGARR